MYCSQCGKKVKENMLFCPFCGSPIVIPEQDDDPAQVSAPAGTVVSNEVPSLAPEKKAEDAAEVFVPLDFSSNWTEAKQNTENTTEESPHESVGEFSRHLKEEPVRLHGRKPDLRKSSSLGAPKISSRKTAETHVPPAKFDPDNMFLDEDDEDEFDDYEEENMDFEFEEPEHSSFFIRHIRGFVTLILFGVVAIVVLGWTFSATGQMALARTGLAWTPGVYAEVAYEAYQNGSYAQAGSFYVKALEHDADNYEYANSAGVSYYMANNGLNAESMARAAIEIDPSRIEAYELLLRLYPDTASRTVEITELLRKGYQLTGAESLNIQ